jgi:hypothetical protein
MFIETPSSVRFPMTMQITEVSFIDVHYRERLKKIKMKRATKSCSGLSPSDCSISFGTIYKSLGKKTQNELTKKI